MAAIIQDVSIEKGANFQLDITMSESDGTKYELDNYDLQGTMSIGTKSYALSFTEDTDTEVSSWTMLAGETEVLSSGVGRYEIFLLENATGVVDRLLKGRVYVDKGA